jgi:hypothetical protein
MVYAVEAKTNDKIAMNLATPSNFREVRSPAIVGLYVACIHLCDHQVLLNAIGDLALI